LNISFQIVIFLFAYDAIEHNEENTDGNSKQPCQHQLIPPAVLSKDAPRILSRGVIGNKASAEEKHSEYYENYSYMKHSYARDHLCKTQKNKEDSNNLLIDYNR
jgi:hypothetical protein